jgi:hypothetical protein
MKYLILIATAILVSTGAYAQDTCKTYAHKNSHGAAMTISRVWVLDSVNFRVESIPELPFQETASGTYDFKVCILAKDGLKHSTQVRYQTTHGPVSYNISNFQAPGASGVSEHEVSTKVKLYPNPATRATTLDGASGVWTIYNTLGQKVLTGVATEASQSIDLQSLPKGHYCIKCSSVLGESEIRNLVIQ